MKQGKQTQSETDGTMAEYHLIADTIGGVPNLRGKDNLYQTIAIVVCVVIGAAIGAAIAGEWWIGAVFGTLIALIVSVFVSGSILMVLGWVRASKYKKSRPK